MSKWKLKGVIEIIGKKSDNFTFDEIKLMTDEQLFYYVETIREDTGNDMSYELNSRTSSAYRREFKQKYKLAEMEKCKNQKNATQ